MWQRVLVGVALAAGFASGLLAQEPKRTGVPGGPGAPGIGVSAPRNRTGGVPGPQFGDGRPMRGGPLGEGGPMFGVRPGAGLRMNEFERMRQDDPEMHALVEQDQQLEQQSEELANQLRQAGDKREELKAQLTELVNKHFDIRQQRRELQLKRMETELARLREAIKQRNDVRVSIIKDRIAELTGSPKELGF